MYTITDSNDEIGLNAVINSNMIIGVIDKNNNRTCIMRTYFKNEMYKRFEQSRYVVLPFIKNRKMNNENINNDDLRDIANFECNDIKDLITTGKVLGGKGLNPVKAFDNWEQAYKWILGEE